MLTSLTPCKVVGDNQNQTLLKELTEKETSDARGPLLLLPLHPDTCQALYNDGVFVMHNMIILAYL